MNMEGFRTVIVARKVRDGEDATVGHHQNHGERKRVVPGHLVSLRQSADYWPDYFEDAVQNGMVDWYTGNLYKD